MCEFSGASQKKAPARSSHRVGCGEKQLENALFLLKSIGETQAKFIASGDPREAFVDLLDILLKVTDSNYGFIGEVHRTPEGAPYLKSLAITNIAWNEETQSFYEQNYRAGLEFHNLETLFGDTLRTGKVVISNDPANDSRSGGLPSGHPPLNAYLGIPIFAGEQLIGMAGIANRPEGYDEELVKFLEPLLMTCSNFVIAHRTERSYRRSESARRASEDRLRLAIEAAELGTWDYDPVSGLTICNERWYEMLGYEVNEFALTQDVWEKLIHPDDLESVMQIWETQFQRGSDVFRMEYRARTKGNTWIWVLVTGQVMGRDADGKPTRLAGIQMDNTDRHLAEDQFRLVVESAPNGMLILSADGIIRLVNTRVEELFGYSRNELLGQSVEILIPERYRSHHVDFREHFFQHVTDGVMGEGRDLPGLRKDGSEFSVEVGLNRLDTPEGVQVLASVVDISHRKNLELQIKHQAFHDALTGLPNRSLFLDRLEIAQARARRHQEGVAVIFLDLDNFKVINDSLGHQAGDRFLIAIAERLKSCVRPEDTVARLGGDEFTILLEELVCPENAINAAERIVDALRQPLALDYGEVVASSSIGIAYSTNGEATADSLLRDADTAMYHAKENGKAHYVLFDSQMNAQAVQRMELEMGLRQALDRNEFRLLYQPIVDLNSWLVCGAEALVRWEHPVKGLVSPDQFVPIAEETGLIVPIGEWVLRQACLQMKQWQAVLRNDAPKSISVNLSGKQLQRQDVVKKIAGILEEVDLDPSALKLEITESILMNDVEDVSAKLHKLRDLGIKLAVDDFGTGYSSMSSLSSFPVDTVKLDRAFISRLGKEEEAEAIVAAVIMLSKSMKLDTTAEGLEEEDQVVFLRALGCNMAQGYYFEKPLPPGEFVQWVRDVTESAHEEKSRRFA